METQAKTILSGVTSSGQFTFGHYAGAIKNWIELQDSYNCYYMIADLHAITNSRPEPADLRRRTLEIAASYIACGIDPEKCVLFVQSHVPAHAELAWVLNCIAGIGECSRMTQFKDKSKNNENVSVGLFTYPMLMASDILLYQADLVPVGEDQKQHLELTRNLAERFNHSYSDTFVVPEPFIPPLGARIMSLQEPTKKMSKSDANEKNILYIADAPEVIKNKIKRAVTDSGTVIKYDVNSPGIANLMSIYHVATGKSFAEIEKDFEGCGYGDFKIAVGDNLAEFLAPIRDKYLSTISDKKLLSDILKRGAEAARYKANKTLRKVYKKVGFVEL